MSKRYTILTTLIALAIPGAVTAAGRFSWFDESPARDSMGQIRAPFSLSAQETRLSFGIDAYKSLAPDALGEDYDGTGSAFGDSNVVRFYGEFASRPNEFQVPLAALNAGGDASLLDSANSRLSGFGVKWQHRVDAGNTFALSAGYSEVPWRSSITRLDALDTRAAVSWSGTWSGDWQPGLTGSVFFGDESVRDEAYQQLGRKYYGFSVGGELRVARHHRPYLSYLMKRNFYNPDDPNSLIAPYEDHAEVLAGWKWQVQSNWSLQAEARYGLNGTNIDPYTLDRSRIFFGTRFDFR